MKILIGLIIFHFCNNIIVEAHLSKLELPAYNNERCTPLNNGTNQHYEFIPASTIGNAFFIKLK